MDEERKEKKEREREKEKEKEAKKEKKKSKIRAMQAFLALCLEFQWLTLEQLLNINK